MFLSQRYGANFAQIDGNIEDGSLHHPHQLCLRGIAFLIVQSAQHAA